MRIYPKVITAERFIRALVKVSSVVSPVEPPIEAFGNDRLSKVWE